jgi:hypothetical protein
MALMKPHPAWFVKSRDCFALATGHNGGMITTIVSGGQTGVDRAALDVALELGIRCRGWCPKSRRAEDGPIEPRYPLTETATTAYEERTERNVRDSDGTLVLRGQQESPGTELTISLAARFQKPCLVVDLNSNPDPGVARDWVQQHDIRVLNVAGPRAGQLSGVYNLARSFLVEVLQRQA